MLIQASLSLLLDITTRESRRVFVVRDRMENTAVAVKYTKLATKFPFTSKLT